MSTKVWKFVGLSFVSYAAYHKGGVVGFLALVCVWAWVDWALRGFPK